MKVVDFYYIAYIYQNNNQLQATFISLFHKKIIKNVKYFSVLTNIVLQYSEKEELLFLKCVCSAQMLLTISELCGIFAAIMYFRFINNYFLLFSLVNFFFSNYVRTVLLLLTTEGGLVKRRLTLYFLRKINV